MIVNVALANTEAPQSGRLSFLSQHPSLWQRRIDLGKKPATQIGDQIDELQREIQAAKAQLVLHQQAQRAVPGAMGALNRVAGISDETIRIKNAFLQSLVQDQANFEQKTERDSAEFQRQLDDLFQRWQRDGLQAGDDPTLLLQHAEQLFDTLTQTESAFRTQELTEGTGDPVPALHLQARATISQAHRLARLMQEPLGRPAALQRLQRWLEAQEREGGTSNEFAEIATEDFSHVIQASAQAALDQLEQWHASFAAFFRNETTIAELPFESADDAWPAVSADTFDMLAVKLAIPDQLRQRDFNGVSNAAEIKERIVDPLWQEHTKTHGFVNDQFYLGLLSLEQARDALAQALASWGEAGSQFPQE